MMVVNNNDLIAYLKMARWALHFQHVMQELLDLPPSEIDRLAQQADSYLSGGGAEIMKSGDKAIIKANQIVDQNLVGVRVTILNVRDVKLPAGNLVDVRYESNGLEGIEGMLPLSVLDPACSHYQPKTERCEQCVSEGVYTYV